MYLFETIVAVAKCLPDQSRFIATLSFNRALKHVIALNMLSITKSKCDTLIGEIFRHDNCL